jgi:uncharacterized membrane protein
MIAKGSGLYPSNAFCASMIAIFAMTLVLVAYIFLTDESFVPGNSLKNIIGEGIAFLLLTIIFFGLPVSFIAALVAHLYSLTVLKRFDLPVGLMILIAALLGLLATGIFGLAVSLVFVPLGVIGGGLAGALLFRFQTGRWK